MASTKHVGKKMLPSNNKSGTEGVNNINGSYYNSVSTFKNIDIDNSVVSAYDVARNKGYKAVASLGEHGEKATKDLDFTGSAAANELDDHRVHSKRRDRVSRLQDSKFAHLRKPPISRRKIPQPVTVVADRIINGDDKLGKDHKGISPQSNCVTKPKPDSNSEKLGNDHKGTIPQSNCVKETEPYVDKQQGSVKSDKTTAEHHPVTKDKSSHSEAIGHHDTVSVDHAQTAIYKCAGQPAHTTKHLPLPSPEDFSVNSKLGHRRKLPRVPLQRTSTPKVKQAHSETVGYEASQTKASESTVHALTDKITLSSACESSNTSKPTESVVPKCVKTNSTSKMESDYKPDNATNSNKSGDGNVTCFVPPTLIPSSPNKVGSPPAVPDSHGYMKKVNWKLKTKFVSKMMDAELVNDSSEQMDNNETDAYEMLHGVAEADADKILGGRSGKPNNGSQLTKQVKHLESDAGDAVSDRMQDIEHLTGSLHADVCLDSSENISINSSSVNTSQKQELAILATATSLGTGEPLPENTYFSFDTNVIQELTDGVMSANMDTLKDELIDDTDNKNPVATASRLVSPKLCLTPTGVRHSLGLTNQSCAVSTSSETAQTTDDQPKLKSPEEKASIEGMSVNGKQVNITSHEIEANQDSSTDKPPQFQQNNNDKHEIETNKDSNPDMPPQFQQNNNDKHEIKMFKDSKDSSSDKPQQFQQKARVERTPSYRRRVMARAKSRYKKSSNCKECSCTRLENGELDVCQFCENYDKRTKRSHTSLGVTTNTAGAEGFSDDQCGGIANPRRTVTPELSSLAGHGSPRTLRRVQVSPRVELLMSSSLFRKHLKKHEDLLTKHTMSYKRFGMRKSVSNLDLSDTLQLDSDNQSQGDDESITSDYTGEEDSENVDPLSVSLNLSSIKGSRRHSLTGESDSSLEYCQQVKKKGGFATVSGGRSKTRPPIPNFKEYNGSSSQKHYPIPSFREFRKRMDRNSDTQSDNDDVKSSESANTSSANLSEIPNQNLRTIVESNSTENLLAASQETLKADQSDTLQSANKTQREVKKKLPDLSACVEQEKNSATGVTGVTRTRPDILHKQTSVPNLLEKKPLRMRKKLKSRALSQLETDSDTQYHSTGDLSDTGSSSQSTPRRTTGKRPRSLISKKTSLNSLIQDSKDPRPQSPVDGRQKLKVDYTVNRSKSDTSSESNKGKNFEDYEKVRPTYKKHTRHLSLQDKGGNYGNIEGDDSASQCSTQDVGESETSTSFANSTVSDSLFSEVVTDEAGKLPNDTYDPEDVGKLPIDTDDQEEASKLLTDTDDTSELDLSRNSKDDSLASVLRSTSDACTITPEAARKRRERRERPYKSDPFSGTEIIPASKRCQLREERAKLKQHKNMVALRSSGSVGDNDVMTFLDGELGHGESFPSLEELNEDDEQHMTSTETISNSSSKLKKHVSNVSSLSTDSGVIGQDGSHGYGSAHSSPSNTLQHPHAQHSDNYSSGDRIGSGLANDCVQNDGTGLDTRHSHSYTKSGVFLSGPSGPSGPSGGSRQCYSESGSGGPPGVLKHSHSEYNQRAWQQALDKGVLDKGMRALSCSDLTKKQVTDCVDCSGGGQTPVQQQQQVSHVCAACYERRIERKRTVQEIMDTEINYGRDLNILKEEFYIPMMKAGLLNKEQLDSIFLNLDELIHVNKHFITKLKASIHMANQHNDDDLQQVMIGNMFLESSTMFLTFENYCVNQAQAPILLESLEREKELLRIFLSVSQNDNHLLRRMHLKSFLMVPVQRIMRYPLLLDRLFKATPSGNRDKDSIKEAKDKIEDILGHINAKSRTTSVKNRKSSSEKHYSVTEKIEVSRVALETLKWNRKDVCDVITSRLYMTQPLDHMWAVKKCKNYKFTTVHAVLLTLVTPLSEDEIHNRHHNITMTTATTTPPSSPVTPGNKITHSTHNNNNNNNNATQAGGGITSAALVLIKEKSGKYVVAREPFMLESCVVSQDPDYTDVFEILEWNREAFLFKGESAADTRAWIKSLRQQMHNLGCWRKRRNALPNILLNHLS